MGNALDFSILTVYLGQPWTKRGTWHLRGYFITLEGIEGAGKTSQLPAMTDLIEEAGYKVETTREPGGSEIASKIRNILLDPANDGLVPMAELLLYLADRAQHVSEMIVPALEEGKVVICDRYADATVAYQGYARNLGAEKVIKLNRHATGGLTPDLTLLFDLSVETGLTRANKRIDQMVLFDLPPENRFELEEVTFHQNVRKGYLSLAKANPQRFEIINAENDIQGITKDIKSVLSKRLAAWSTIR